MFPYKLNVIPFILSTTVNLHITLEKHKRKNLTLKGITITPS
jgi:hypothetical protein